MFIPSTAIVARWTLMAGIGLALAGCTASGMPIEYASTINRPVTLQLVDPNTKSVVWEKAIPVNQRMTVWIHHPGDVPLMSVSKAPADSIKWAIYDGTSSTAVSSPVESGQDDLSGGPVVLNYVIRTHPEYPAGYEPPVPLGTANLTGYGPPATTVLPPTPIPLPPAVEPMVEPAPPLTNPPSGLTTEIDLTQSGLRIGGRLVEMTELTGFLQALAKEDPHRKIVVTATDSSDTAVARLAEVLKACTDAGLENVQVISAPAPEPTTAP